MTIQDKTYRLKTMIGAGGWGPWCEDTLVEGAGKAIQMTKLTG